MTNRTRKLCVVSAMVCTFFVIGVPYWVIPYTKVNLPNGLFHPGLLMAFVVPLLLCAFRAVPFLRATWLTTAVVVAVVFARVVVEGVADPTSHNLWPLEVIISVLVGVVASVPGAAVGILIKRMASYNTTRRE